MKSQLLQEIVDAHRFLRHDFNNDLQVILGYLQIGQVEKAYSYGKKTAQSLEDFNSLGKCKALLVQSYLLNLLSLSKENVHLRIDEDVECGYMETDILTFLRALLDPLREQITNGELIIEIRLLPGPFIRIRFICMQESIAWNLSERIRILNKKHQETLDLSINTETHCCVTLNIAGNN